MSKQDRIEKYLNYKRINNMHNSVNTTRKYRNIIVQWSKFQGTPDDYLKHLSESKDSAQVKTTLHILRDYASFLDDACLYQQFDSLVKHYRINVLERQAKKIRRDELVLTEFEIQSLMKQAENEYRFKTGDEYYISYRNWLMVKMLANYGMRIKALVSIQLEDINFKKRLIIIQSSKNKNPYPLPIIKMIGDLQHYISVVRKDFGQCKNYESGPLFLSKTGKQISATSARRAINKIAAQAGVYEPQRSTHQIRHYRATKYLRDGLQPDIISQIMGVSVEILRQNYFHMTHDDTVREFENWMSRTEIKPVCPNCGYDQRNGRMSKKNKPILLKQF